MKVPRYGYKLLANLATAASLLFYCSKGLMNSTHLTWICSVIYNSFDEPVDWLASFWCEIAT
ncbi:hypothetical protein PVAP13_2KG243758 [Panicum virgatum]|uniref:Uncharacterized protein n=1 Tax=Panicum virgatum TaxID=38727 RepID=A0A8T0VXD2_PANVG|nr:hypothetical protein PVAP13_2KG243758 [Panicum virgatum]